MNLKNLFLVLFSALMLLSCKSKPINQKIDRKKEGVWMDDYTQDGINYKSYEYYKNDQPVKKWKSYINGKIYKTEKYKNGICIVKSYYENGKLESKGKTKLETNSVETHWFYFGEWKFYSDKGKLKGIKNYEKGELISEQNIK
jgi:antitoxin component YwqK of YwqJK toxin-antitoxin module